MKKTLLAFGTCVLLLWACKKESTSTPTACFTATIVDSAKIKNMDTALVRDFLSHSTQYLVDSAYLFSRMDSINKVKVDSVVKIHADGFFTTIIDSTPIFKQPVFFKYCGTPSAFRVIYTGDAGHQYYDSASNVSGLGVNFPTDIFTYNYTTAQGRFNVAVIATNTADFGKDVKRSVVTQVIKTN